jgi:hypothetical protein
MASMKSAGAASSIPQGCALAPSPQTAIEMLAGTALYGLCCGPIPFSLGSTRWRGCADNQAKVSKWGMVDFRKFSA